MSIWGNNTMKEIIKKAFIAVLFAVAMPLFSGNAYAQQIKIGTFSYEAALKSMPEYALAKQQVSDISNQYADELKGAEKEFSEKYELFLEQQATLAPAIREKRQSELQLLLERNAAFRLESERLLKQADDEAMTPVRKKLDDTIKKLGLEQSYAVLINTDSNSCPFIHPMFVEDVNDILQDMLK